MANLFSSFLDKDNPAKRLEKEIQNTQFKKQSLVTPFQNEINTARQKIDSILYQIGKDVYECHENGEEVGERLMARFDEIASQKALILEKEAKVKEFSSRYDEEIAILQASLTAATQPPAAPQGQPYAPPPQPAFGDRQTGYCGNCGKPYAVGEDAFCMSCGQKLEQ